MGQFIVTFIFGGISAEIIRAKSKSLKMMKDSDFVWFSLEMHDVDFKIQAAINQFI